VLCATAKCARFDAGLGGREVLAHRNCRKDVAQGVCAFGSGKGELKTQSVDERLAVALMDLKVLAPVRSCLQEQHDGSTPHSKS
jgi:hypothetical protein